MPLVDGRSDVVPEELLRVGDRSRHTARELLSADLPVDRVPAGDEASLLASRDPAPRESHPDRVPERLQRVADRRGQLRVGLAIPKSAERAARGSQLPAAERLAPAAGEEPEIQAVLPPGEPESAEVLAVAD